MYTCTLEEHVLYSIYIVHMYVMRKVQILTILGFRCAKLRLALCAIHPRISLRKARISAIGILGKKRI